MIGNEKKLMYENLCSKKANDVSNLTLAYIVDGLYELFIRLYVLERTGANIKGIHRQVIRAVSATGQAESFRKISEILNEYEINIYKRGRNTHTSSMSKNANPADYQTATGVETLLGFLFIDGKYERAEFIMEKMAEAAFSNENQENS